MSSTPSETRVKTAKETWERDYAAQIGQDREIRNRSGFVVRPLYTSADCSSGDADAALGYPGQMPFTRGIYPTMHRGRAWTQRQLVGLSIPEDYNERLHDLLRQGASAISLIPCNSVYRGYDADEVDPNLLGTCGVVVNTVEDMDICLSGLDVSRVSIGLNDPLPFTLLALVFAVAGRQGIAPAALTGTSNQSDYLSHFAANHMFLRLALPGSRRMLTDHVAYMRRVAPRWNPVSVVGQHMQQAGATPAQAMAFALCTAIQYAVDCKAAGMSADDFLPRFSFFFDISISFFEEIAKFRAGRRLWARIARDRFGASDPRAWRFKFHAQTSGVDLTRQQPLNNIARTAVQAMAGIFGGLQSLHTDAYDEVLSTPTVESARIAVNTQNILREEAHLTDVIDPLGGSYYVEALTEQMEAEIEATIKRVDDAGGMFAAVQGGLVQRLIGESATEFQRSVESGDQVIVGVNNYVTDEGPSVRASQARPDPARIEAHLRRLAKFRANRRQSGVDAALSDLSRAAHDPADNLFARVVDSAAASATHGEICKVLRAEIGFGAPLVAI